MINGAQVPRKFIWKVVTMKIKTNTTLKKEVTVLAILF